MDKDLRELYSANDDIVYILDIGQKIGWNDIKEQSIHRIIYLSKVLFSFVNGEAPNIIDYYHFTAQNMPGPTSSVITKSLVYLESAEMIRASDSGLRLNTTDESRARILDPSENEVKKEKQLWLRTIMLLLGKFGENRVFSFTINDPLYIEKMESNSPMEITFEDNENKTLTVLNSFKEAFEDSLDDTSGISKEEYLEFYFDYVFSQIIK